MFDFTVPNKLASDVSSKLKQTQPYGTSDASASVISGISSSIKEATSIRKRRSKKSLPKAKLKK
jgi:hypothetical protein